MIVIYAEKPDVGKKIAAALDCVTLSDGKKITFEKLSAADKSIKSQQFKDGYLKINYCGEETYVTWGYGHLCELKQAYDYDPDYRKWSNLPLPFIPNNYEIKVKDGGVKQFNIVKGLLSKCRYVINATDFDREGELIFNYLMTAANCTKPFKRAHFSSQTKDGINDAFASLKSSSEVKSMTDAGRGRSIADWVIGSNLTVAMSLKYPGSGVLSIGRVQTPTLNMLVERELSIKNFKPEKYYTIEALFKTKKNEEFKAEHKKKRFSNLEEVQAVMSTIKDHNGIVKNIDKRTLNKEAPLLYNLSTLQMAANSRFGFTIAKTLDVAQSLYEGGFTTYPRTDSQYLTEDMEPVVNAVLDNLSKETEYSSLINGRSRKIDKKHYFCNSKVTSHFAIIPTTSKPIGLTEDQKKIYDLIARSVIMMIYSYAQIEKTSVLIDVSGESFIASGSVITKDGWMEVDSSAKESFLPALNTGDELCGSYNSNEKYTEPPKHYTDKTLVSAMISAGKELDDEGLKKVMDSGIKGIGTEATRASIIEALIKRGYAEREKKNIIATQKGISLIQALPLKEIKSAELTAVWEGRLNDVAIGKESFDKFVKDIESLTNRWCNEVCDSEKQNSFCEKHDNATGVCPLCGKNVIKQKWGWGCSGYKSGCQFKIQQTIAGKKITDKQAEAIMNKGSTSMLKGFTSKAGKPFSARLVLDKDGKINFSFK